MPEEWTGWFVGEMHVHKVRQRELSEELGISITYISDVLNGKRGAITEKTKQKFEAGLKAIVERGRNDEGIS